jgi:TonB family protein
MTVVRVTLRNSRGELAHWSFLIGLSLALHLAAGVALIVLPMAFRTKVRFPQIYTVDLMSLPAGAPGPKAGSPDQPPAAAKAAPPAAKPAPKPAVKAPAPPPPKLKAAIKIPEKPNQKAAKPKPAEKAKPSPPKEPEKTSDAATDESTGDSSGAASASEAKAPGKTSESSPSAGGGGEGGTGGGGAGGIDDPTFQYGWYYANIQGIISRNWSRPIKPDMAHTLAALVRFRVMKNGSLSDIVLVQSSGDAALDRSAMRAVQDSNPLPPLPFQFAKDSVGFTLEFELNPD